MHAASARAGAICDPVIDFGDFCITKLAGTGRVFCPMGMELAASAADILCAGTTCTVADKYTCCDLSEYGESNVKAGADSH